MFGRRKGALDHGYMREVFLVGEGDGFCGAAAAAGLAFDADAVEGGLSVGVCDAPHGAYLKAAAATGAAGAVARGLGFEETGRGVVGLQGSVVFIRMGFAGNMYCGRLAGAYFLRHLHGKAVEGGEVLMVWSPGTEGVAEGVRIL